jgi:hypothetical protein
MDGWWMDINENEDEDDDSMCNKQQDNQQKEGLEHIGFRKKTGVPFLTLTLHPSPPFLHEKLQVHHCKKERKETFFIRRRRRRRRSSSSSCRGRKEGKKEGIRAGKPPFFS